MAKHVVEDDCFPYSRKYKSEDFEIYKFGNKETYELMVYECGRENARRCIRSTACVTVILSILY